MPWPPKGSGGASTLDHFITTQADADLPNSTILGNIIMQGANAAKPAAGIPGRLYYATDNPIGTFYDTGAAWIPKGVLTVRRAADSAPLSNSIVLTNDGVLLFPVLANEVWFVEAVLLVNAANAVMDFKCGWSLPAAATMQWNAADVPNSQAPAGWGPSGTGSAIAAILTEASSLACGTGTAITEGVVLRGIAIVGANAGNVNLQWCQNTSDAGNLIMKANSQLLLTKLT